MTPRTIILQGGENVKVRNQSNLFRELVSNASVSSILIIPWTTDSLEKEYKYREIYLSYFRDAGFQTIEFIERGDTETEIEEKFMKSDILYLPGGDPVILKREIEKKSLQEKHAIIGLLHWQLHGLLG